MKILTSLLLLICPLMLFSSVFNVGPNKAYKSPNELHLAAQANPNLIADGDTIYIDEGEYRGRSALAVWRPNELHIIGLGEPPELYADGQYILGKGIWVASGNNIHVKNIAFYDAVVPDKNGAGIRLDGNGLHVQECYFFNNENGILVNNSGVGTVQVYNSEFGLNGHGDGFSHNIYVGRIERFILEGCLMRGAFIGHQTKSRAQTNIITYNRFADGSQGRSSHLLDIPNGGLTFIVGNEFIQGENAENKRLVAYGTEGLSNNSQLMFMANNTLVNYRRTGTFVHAQNGSVARVKNNVFCGVGEVATGSVYLEGNQHYVEIDDAKFRDAANEDFYPLKGSPLIDVSVAPDSVNTVAIEARLEYDHPTNVKLRPMSLPIDIGAREHQNTTKIKNLVEARLVYPNPAVDELIIDSKREYRSYQIYSLTGQLVKSGELVKQCIDISNLDNGEYLLHLLNDRQTKSVLFLK